MPKRPGNECLHCGYEWNPKGHDLAARCPECKSTSVDYARKATAPLHPSLVDYTRKATAPSRSSLTVPLACGCGLMVLVLGGAVVAAGVFGGRRAVVVEKADVTGNDSKANQKAGAGNDGKPDPSSDVKKPPALKDDPPKVAIAPPPRPVPLNRPPEGFTFAWVQRGGVRTRVAGARHVTHAHQRRQTRVPVTDRGSADLGRNAEPHRDGHFSPSVVEPPH